MVVGVLLVSILHILLLCTHSQHLGTQFAPRGISPPPPPPQGPGQQPHICSAAIFFVRMGTRSPLPLPVDSQPHSLLIHPYHIPQIALHLCPPLFVHIPCFASLPVGAIGVFTSPPRSPLPHLCAALTSKLLCISCQHYFF
ncbi:hypothetical protein GPALN_001849 [Globodera pallida]|nr:hypothetical protein GPALN_001849 [Globodera pallida]